MLIGFSLDHRRATAAAREPFVLPPAEAARLGRLVRRACGGQLVLLITCNRAELFTWVTAADPQVAVARIRQIATRLAPGLAEPFLTLAARYFGRSAAEHLLRVAAGLESQVEGDIQVLGQVRAAYAVAAACGSVGAELHRLFQTALRTGKRVHAETDYGRRRVSVGGEAARWLVLATAPQPGDSAARRVMVVGAGRTAEEAVRVLVEDGAEVTIVNRTLESAVALARRFGASWARFEERHDLIAQADSVIVATGAAKPTVRLADLEAACCHRDGARQPLQIVDLGMPRNVDPAIATLPGVRLSGMENVAPAQDGTVTVQRAAAERIVSKELAGLVAWLTERTDRREDVA